MLRAGVPACELRVDLLAGEDMLELAAEVKVKNAEERIDDRKQS